MVARSTGWYRRHVVPLVIVGMLSAVLLETCVCISSSRRPVYQIIRPGMTSQEVDDILGEAYSGYFFKGNAFYTWFDDDDSRIIVSFSKGRAYQVTVDESPDPMMGRVRRLMTRFRQLIRVFL